MLRKVGVIVIILLMLITIYAQDQNEQLALETIARINEWRIAEGTWPLRINPILTDMAIDHARYLASLDELPDDLHAGPTGLNPRERALLAPYEWSHYELPEQIAIGENAGIGTLDYAMSYWHDSETHRSTALNPAYREVGVGAIPYKSGHVFIVVFGGRPNILPALLDPRDGQTIYLSNEMFEYAQFFNSVQNVLEYQLFGSDGQPLFDTPQPWTQVIEIPEGAGDNIYLLLTDGDHQVLSAVNRNNDQVIVMASLLEPEVEEALEDEGVEETETTATPEQSEVVVQEDTAADTTPEPTQEPTVEPVADQPEILILYSNNTLDIINVSGGNANWENMELQGLTTTQFSKFTQFTDLDLSNMPDRHCVQIRSNGISGDVVKPESCNWVRSLITVQSDRVFWNAGAFDVYKDGNSIGTCVPDQQVCEIDFDS